MFLFNSPHTALKSLILHFVMRGFYISLVILLPRLVQGQVSITGARIEKAFAALRGNGSVITWGDASSGGDSSSVSSSLVNVQSIYSTAYAFAALTGNGSVVTWGRASSGGDSSSVSSSLVNVQSISSTLPAFAALRGNKSVVTWGDDRQADTQSSFCSNRVFDPRIRSVTTNVCASIYTYIHMNLREKVKKPEISM